VLWGNAEDDADGIFAHVNSELSVAPPAATATTFYGRHVRLEYSGTGGFSGSAHAAAVSGVVAMNSSGETAALLIGVKSEVENAAGTVTSAVGFRAQAPTNAGTITTFTGLDVQVPAGTVTNEVGVNIGALAGATLSRGLVSAIAAGAGKHNIYVSGTAVNYLEGALRVGADVDMGCLIGSDDGIAVKFTIAEPTPVPDYACIYVDTADNHLKAISPNGVVLDIGDLSDPI
jgi:hypothetical protein